MKSILVEITSAFVQDPSRPRPKWWDNYIGEKFRCYDSEGWWKLSTWGLKKLSKLKGSKSYYAIIHKECGKVVKG